MVPFDDVIMLKLFGVVTQLKIELLTPNIGLTWFNILSAARIHGHHFEWRDMKTILEFSTNR